MAKAMTTAIAFRFAILTATMFIPARQPISEPSLCPARGAIGRIVLELERTKKTRVLLDGVSVGPRQMSYSTPHRYEITPFCRAGAAHTLTIELDHSASDMPHAL